ncbi:MAG: cyclomaltodextrinase N-terminal domain-containing protein [Chitinophagaceae bacterium]|nr:cyclomaltodextrinase N-terminal domain-containing protein [Chitinophagaceae bacterium]
MKKFFLLAMLFIVTAAGANDNYNIYPTHWWVGMKNPKLQLIIHSNNISGYNKATVNNAGVKVDRVSRGESKNYLFIDLTIQPGAKTGTMNIVLSGNGLNAQTLKYELKQKSKQDGVGRIKGVTSEDLIYLLMPDRFANGDPNNDYFPDMRDGGHSRDNPFDRHGGDLQGVTSHLDYLKDLGVTAVWMTPVNENDMARTLENGTMRSTYHGYAFTDQYNVDRRLGGNAAYKELVETAHSKGIKIIQDAVYNHLGRDHWSVLDLPMKDWLNQWPSYQNTSYKEQPLVDPYASAIDSKITLDGWFTPFLVDLNQRNPYVSNFLIQYAIWSTEEFGFDAWRVDTYFYNDPVFLNKINDALVAEFPKVTVFGETSVNQVLNAAYFCQNNINAPFKHNCQGVTDFPVFYAMIDALNQPFGWNEGMSKLYQTLAQDVLYKNPMRNEIFLDNHDQDRFFSMVGENFKKYKMGMAMLMTLRGIPQLYYGDEILMKNTRNPTDAEVRKDFPGGWSEDKKNKFVSADRNDNENEAFDYVKALAQFRKTSSAIKTGKFMQFVPQDGLFVYFRYDNKQTVMVVMNTNDKDMKPDWSRFEERIKGFTKARNVVSGTTHSIRDMEIDSHNGFVFELLK